MMSDEYVKGIAFILEGQTEFVFYCNYLKYLCARHPDFMLTETENLSDLDACYTLTNTTLNTKIIIMLHCFSAISQVAHSGNWFNNNCIGKHKKIPWTVFLCYDTDSHNDNITKFHEGDWKILRDKINHKNTTIIDMAASADIEDLFLKDLHGIGVFLGVKSELTEDEIPKGRKGKVRLKALYRNNGQYYHEGPRAESLIKSLNMQTLIDCGLLPLIEIEKVCFF